MRIKKLELKNFRGFEELVIDFPEGEGGLAVFVGVNGSGKTSVLDALKSLVFTVIAIGINDDKYIKGTSKKRSVLPSLTTSKDLKIGKEESFNSLNFEYSGIEWVTSNHIMFGAVGFSCNPPIDDMDIVFNDENLKEYRPKNWTYDELKNLVKKIKSNPPCFISYVANRIVTDQPSLEAKDITEINSLDIAEEAFYERSDFEEFFEWFRNMEDFESEQMREKENFNLKNKQLESVRKALLSIAPQFDKIRVQRQPHEDFVLEKNGVKMSAYNLSHGERILLAVTGDIARRLNISYPDLENPLLGKGVVLIDEIEQHLHPGWQRNIIPNLRRTFPNIQFIVTTHSPQVLSNVPRENVFILEDFKLVKNTPYTLGRDSNSILWDIFGVEKRPKEAEKIFSKLYRTMDDPDKVEETEKMLRDVEKRYGYYDEEVVRARSHFHLLTEA